MATVYAKTHFRSRERVIAKILLDYKSHHPSPLAVLLMTDGSHRSTTGGLLYLNTFGCLLMARSISDNIFYALLTDKPIAIYVSVSDGNSLIFRDLMSPDESHASSWNGLAVTHAIACTL